MNEGGCTGGAEFGLRLALNGGMVAAGAEQPLGFISPHSQVPTRSQETRNMSRRLSLSSQAVSQAVSPGTSTLVS